MEDSYTDILVIGSGVAGSYAAMHAASLGARVTLVTKTRLLSGSTRWAQGGVAFPSDPNDIPSHLRDTIKAGRGLVDERVSKTILTEALEQLGHLIELGVHFDPDPALEGGHSKPRVLHINGDESGLHLITFLHDHLPTEVSTLENHYAAHLISDGSSVAGAVFWKDGNPGSPLAINAGSTVIATGGIGQVYSFTTNPAESTGDGIALAYRSGALVRDMELVQFHPTVLANGGLISEACRGAGAELINNRGERFMKRYDPAGELAPRDIVSRSIYQETLETGGVYIDLRPIQDFAHKFPTVYSSIVALDIDPISEPVPVQPAAHFLMGGILTDDFGATSLTNLYAVGEAASTGFHGANRLASNSLLEGLVMGSRAAGKAVESSGSASLRKPEPATVPGTPAEVRRHIRTTMTKFASVARDEKGLSTGLTKISDLPISTARNAAEAETENLRLIALMILNGALKRQESRGSHYRTDYPETRVEAKHIEQCNLREDSARD